MANPFDFSTGAVLTAAQLNQIGDYESFTGSWSDGVTVGNATQRGVFAQVNEICYFQYEFEAGSTTSYSTAAFDLDISASGLPASVSDLNYVHCGGGWVRMTASGTIYQVFLFVIQSAQIIIPYAGINLGTNYLGVGSCKSNVPSTWGTDSKMYFQGQYRTS
jgi:hypothetical protein